MASTVEQPASAERRSGETQAPAAASVPTLIAHSLLRARVACHGPNRADQQ